MEHAARAAGPPLVRAQPPSVADPPCRNQQNVAALKSSRTRLNPNLDLPERPLRETSFEVVKDATWRRSAGATGRPSPPCPLARSDPATHASFAGSRPSPGPPPPPSARR